MAYALSAGVQSTRYWCDCDPESIFDEFDPYGELEWPDEPKDYDGEETQEKADRCVSKATTLARRNGK